LDLEIKHSLCRIFEEEIAALIQIEKAKITYILMFSITPENLMGFVSIGSKRSLSELEIFNFLKSTIPNISR